jgi:GTP-dependent phosphoenolpyruvate carboxykinase
MGIKVLDKIADNNLFVKCLHTVGCPLPTTRMLVNNWPCNPEMTMIVIYSLLSFTTQLNSYTNSKILILGSFARKK